MFTRKIVFALSAMMVLAAQASAQVPCGERGKMVSLLGEKYSEASVGYGLAGQKSMIEVFVSEKGSFTILSTQTSGLSCIIAAGHNWENLTPPKKLTAL